MSEFNTNQPEELPEKMTAGVKATRDFLALPALKELMSAPHKVPDPNDQNAHFIESGRTEHEDVEQNLSDAIAASLQGETMVVKLAWGLASGFVGKNNVMRWPLEEASQRLLRWSGNYHSLISVGQSRSKKVIEFSDYSGSDYTAAIDEAIALIGDSDRVTLVDPLGKTDSFLAPLMIGQDKERVQSGLFVKIQSGAFGNADTHKPGDFELASISLVIPGQKDQQDIDNSGGDEDIASTIDQLGGETLRDARPVIQYAGELATASEAEGQHDPSGDTTESPAVPDTLEDAKNYNQSLNEFLGKIESAFMDLDKGSAPKIGLDGGRMNRLGQLDSELQKPMYVDHPEFAAVLKGAILGATRDANSVDNYYGSRIRSELQSLGGEGMTKLLSLLDGIVQHRIDMLRLGSKHPHLFDEHESTFGSQLDISAQNIDKFEINEYAKSRAKLLLRGLAVGASPPMRKKRFLNDIQGILKK